MILSISFLVVAFAIQGLMFYFCNWYQSWVWIWTWFVLPFAFYWGLFASFIIYLAIASGFYKLKTYSKPSRYAQFIVSQTAFILMVLFRVRPHFRGMGKVPDRHSRFMLVNNHLSIFDEFALIYAFRNHDVLYVSKVENFDIPVAGPWFKKAGCLPIKQGDLLNGAQVISRGVEEIKSKRHSICIAPEGTRNKTFPEPLLLPFHPGTFTLAKEAHCPIVVAAIQNTNAVFRRWPLHRTHIYLDVVGVVDTEIVEQKNVQELAETARSMILKRFEEKEARFYHLDPKKSKDNKAVSK